MQRKMMRKELIVNTQTCQLVDLEINFLRVQLHLFAEGLSTVKRRFFSSSRGYAIARSPRVVANFAFAESTARIAGLSRM